MKAFGVNFCLPFLTREDKFMAKQVLITGASSGIGQACALESVRQGYQVHLVARRWDYLKAVQAACDQVFPGSAFIYQIDLADMAKTDQALSDLLAKHQIDILVNCAGIGLAKPLLETSYEEIVKLFQVNVLALAYLSKRLASHMLVKGSGHIVNIGSLAGKVPTASTSIYSATKAAVISLSDALRLELKDYGVYVTSVNLGPVDTDFFEKAGVSSSYLAKLSSLTLDPDQVAKRIVKIYMKPKRQVNLPIIMSLGVKLHNLFPSLSEAFIYTFFKK